MSEVFTLKHTDFERSPYTGMDRESWIEAAQYICDGFFRKIRTADDPPLCIRTETEVTYPHLKAPKEQQARERKAEVFEGLTRSMFTACALIADHKDAEAGTGIRLADYYSRWILKVTDPFDPWYVGSYEDMQESCDTEDPFRIFQQTVETCALVICLDATEEEIWNSWSDAERDKVASFLLNWAGKSTVPQNWRLFNMLNMAFLKKHGYTIDETIMLEHAAAIVNYYAGDGWYRDGQSFDFYSCWAFNVYAPIWCKWYGYEYAPQIAKQYEKYSNELMKTYASMFDVDGWTLLWGRSSIYRYAATSAFIGNFSLKKSDADPGLSRRICSGSLLQFLSREDYLAEGVPCIGFYGPFSPLVQGYSCAESVYWSSKAFLCLLLPKDHPFWTAKEANGEWEHTEVPLKTTVLNGPALCISNHIANGETILRTGKVVKRQNDLNGIWEYGKLSYNTKYPWESLPEEEICRMNGAANASPKDMPPVGAQEYILYLQNGSPLYGNVTFWGGERDRVLYRRRFYDWEIGTESHWTECIELADMAVPYGILRCDRLRLNRRPMTVTLGSYGFPDNGTEVIRRSEDGAMAIILKGKDHIGTPKQMAMTVSTGWSKLDLIRRTGTNPESRDSIVLYAETRNLRHYDASEPHILVSQVITKESHDDFTEEELFPIRAIETEDRYGTGAFGKVRLVMKDGSIKTVSFEETEGNLLV